jgi:hypothetical protein
MDRRRAGAGGHDDDSHRGEDSDEGLAHALTVDPPSEDGSPSNVQSALQRKQTPTLPWPKGVTPVRRRATWLVGRRPERRAACRISQRHVERCALVLSQRRTAPGHGPGFLGRGLAARRVGRTVAVERSDALGAIAGQLAEQLAARRRVLGGACAARPGGLGRVARRGPRAEGARRARRSRRRRRRVAKGREFSEPQERERAAAFEVGTGAGGNGPSARARGA